MHKRDRVLFRDITLVDEHYNVREHQNIVTENGVITYVGEDLPQNVSGGGRTVYDGKNKVALPGFYNLHCHIPMVLLRGYGEGLPLQRWLEERMFPFEDLMTADDMYWGTLLGMAELLRSGAVSFSDMYMELDGILRALDQVGMKANLCHGTTSFDENITFPETRGYAGTQIVTSYVKQVAADPERAGLVIGETAVHAEYTNTEGLVRQVAQYAAENGLGIQVHVSETKSEHDACKTRRNGRTPARFFADCGVFDGRATAAHCVWLEEEDVDILKEKEVTVAHCPSSNLKLGSGIAPIASYINQGVRVAIGTDGAASNNNLNMLEEVELASMVQKGATGDALVMGPGQMLELACHNGAMAQGRPDCGRIQVGNRADIVVYDLDRPYMRPVFDVLSNIFYAAQADAVAMTMVDGRILYRDGAFPSIDMEQVLYNAERIRREKLAKLAK